MDTFADLIALWGVRARLADDLGVKLDRVHKWAQKNSIPGEFDVAIVEAASRRGIAGVTFEALARIRAGAAVVEAA